MDRKIIDKLLKGCFGYQPTVREISWYEIYHEPRKESHMSGYDKINMNKKNLKAEINNLEDWVNAMKSTLQRHCLHINYDEDVSKIILRIYKFLDMIAREEQKEWRRKQLRYMVSWHKETNTTPPKEVKKLINEMYANK